MKNLLFKSVVLAFLIILSSDSVQAQNNNIKLRVSAGAASAAGVFDGYFYSFDVGIPLGKYFEVAPTFAGASMSPEESVRYSLSVQDQETILYTYSNKPGFDKESVNGDVLNSVGAVLYYKPLAHFETTFAKKNEILIGAGYGRDSYTRSRASYVVEGGEVRLRSFNHKVVTNWSPIYLRLAYSHYFNERSYIGGVMGFTGFDGDGLATLGIQVGTSL